MTFRDFHIPDPQVQPEFYSDVPLKRAAAWVVDTVLVLVISVLILPATFFAGIFFFPLLMLMIGFAYRVITIAQGSATLGMRLMAIEFRTASGNRFDTMMALWHTALFTGCFAVFPLQIVSGALMLVSPRAQGLPDHALGTVAINRTARF